MKKLLIFSLLLIVVCGRSEEEIQARIDNAVEQATSTTSSTTTSSTTTTTIERVEWTATKLKLDCLQPDDLKMDINYQKKYDLVVTALLGDNVNKIIIEINLEGEEYLQEYLATSPLNDLSKGKTFSETIGLTINKDIKNFSYKVTIFESAGTFSETCEVVNNLDFNNLKPFIEVLSCPETIKQGSEIELKVKVIARSYDVAFVQFDLLADSYTDTLIKSNLEDLPSRNYNFEILTITWDSTIKSQDYNIVWKATAVDTTGLETTVVCGIRAEQ